MGKKSNKNKPSGYVYTNFLSDEKIDNNEKKNSVISGNEKIKLNDINDHQIGKNVLLIYIPEKFRNNCWAESFGLFKKN